MFRLAIASVVAALALVAVPAAAPDTPTNPCFGMVVCMPLNVVFDHEGTGGGIVTVSPGGVNCRFVPGTSTGSGTCSGYLRSPSDTAQATVAVTPDEGSFATCIDVITVVACPTTIAYTICQTPGCINATEADIVVWFNLKQVHVSVTRSGVGTGTVTSSPAGITCSPSCSGSFAYGTRVKLTAVPDAGAAFQAWTGACAGQGATCSITVKSPITTNAVFGLASAAPAPPTTTTITTTTTTTTTTPATPPPPKPLAARLVSVGVDGNGAARMLHVRLRVSRRARAEIRLLRKGFERYERVFPVASGANALVARLPRAVARGSYTLHVAVADGAGREIQFSKLVTVPK